MYVTFVFQDCMVRNRTKSRENKLISRLLMISGDFNQTKSAFIYSPQLVEIIGDHPCLLFDENQGIRHVGLKFLIATVL